MNAVEALFLPFSIIILVLFLSASSAMAETLCTFNGTDTSQDGLQLTGFSVEGPRNVDAGGSIEIRFDIKNTNQAPMNLTDKGIFAAVRDRDNQNRDFGFTSANGVLNPSASVHFQKNLTIDRRGLWDIWPSYEYWKTAYSTVLEHNVTLRVKGPDFWQGCELEICPDYCEGSSRFYGAFVGQDNNCTYEQETCANGCEGNACKSAPILPAKDTIQPLVAITDIPSTINTSSGVAFEVTARDDTNVTGVSIFLNGSKVKTCSGKSLKENIDALGRYWTCSYSGGPYPEGSMVFKAEASDPSGNKGSKEKTMIVVSAGTVIISKEETENYTIVFHSISGKIAGAGYSSLNEGIYKIKICPAEKICGDFGRCQYMCVAGSGITIADTKKTWGHDWLDYNIILRAGKYLVSALSQHVGSCNWKTFEPEQLFVDITGQDAENVNFTIVLLGDQEPNVDVLILALRFVGYGNLENAYSFDEIDRIENKAREYQLALAEEGLCSFFGYVDDAETSAISGASIGHANPSEISGAIRQLAQRLGSSYIMMLGGDKRQLLVPPEINDNNYGDIDGYANGLLEVAVGRIPDPINGDVDVILNYLDTAIRLHRSGGIDLSNYQTLTMGDKWITGQCFNKDIFGKPCSSDPNCGSDIDCSLRESNGKGLFTLLLHGSDDEQQKFSCNFPCECSSSCLSGRCVGWDEGKGFLPSDVLPLNVRDTLWLTMSCSGSLIQNKAETADSIPITYLKNGGAIYIGGIRTTYGGKGCPQGSGTCRSCANEACTSCSDEVPGGDSCTGSLYAEIAKRFSIGTRIGDAFKEGKNYYLQHYDCPYGTQYHFDIIRLYGDPTLKIKRMW